MATRCLARRGLALAGAALASTRFRAAGFAGFVAGDFFCALVRAAARAAGFRLAIDPLPVLSGEDSTHRSAGYGARIASVQPEHAVGGAQFGRLDQLAMRDRDGEQRPVQRFFPEAEEIAQRREFRKKIV